MSVRDDVMKPEFQIYAIILSGDRMKNVDDRIKVAKRLHDLWSRSDDVDVAVSGSDSRSPKRFWWYFILEQLFSGSPDIGTLEEFQGAAGVLLERSAFPEIVLLVLSVFPGLLQSTPVSRTAEARYGSGRRLEELVEEIKREKAEE
ncbi:MAG: hypothetical protein RTU30_15275 [Candidatus Thorarchaeota archaeon]